MHVGQCMDLPRVKNIVHVMENVQMTECQHTPSVQLLIAATYKTGG